MVEILQSVVAAHVHTWNLFSSTPTHEAMVHQSLPMYE